MLQVIKPWLGDSDLVRFLNRHFTYKTPHHYIEYADSSNAPRSIYLKNDNQETDSQIFYSTDFNPEDSLIKFLVIKAIETVSETSGVSEYNLGLERVHLTIQHPGQDVEWHQDGGALTAVYAAACPGGGYFTFLTDEGERNELFEDNSLFVFDGKQRHMAAAPDAKRPRVLLVMKFAVHE